jgi:hypothetical protein
MATFKVEILNPEAEKLLKYLADIKLISIKRLHKQVLQMF